MKVTPRAVVDLAKSSGLPEEIIHRYLDQLITFTFAVAKREHTYCYRQIRGWIHSRDVIKPDLIDVLKPNKEIEDEPHDVL